MLLAVVVTCSGCGGLPAGLNSFLWARLSHQLELGVEAHQAFCPLFEGVEATQNGTRLAKHSSGGLVTPSSRLSPPWCASPRWALLPFATAGARSTIVVTDSYDTITIEVENLGAPPSVEVLPTARAAPVEVRWTTESDRIDASSLIVTFWDGRDIVPAARAGNLSFEDHVLRFSLSGLRSGANGKLHVFAEGDRAVVRCEGVPSCVTRFSETAETAFTMP